MKGLMQTSEQNIQIKQSSLSTIFDTWFKSKIDIRKLQTFAGEVFIDRFFCFFCYYCCFKPKWTFFRNFSHY